MATSLAAVLFEYRHAGRPPAELIGYCMTQPEPLLFFENSNTCHLSRGPVRGNLMSRNDTLVKISYLIYFFIDFNVSRLCEWARTHFLHRMGYRLHDPTSQAFLFFKKKVNDT